MIRKRIIKYCLNYLNDLRVWSTIDPTSLSPSLFLSLPPLYIPISLTYRQIFVKHCGEVDLINNCSSDFTWVRMQLMKYMYLWGIWKMSFSPFVCVIGINLLIWWPIIRQVSLAFMILLFFSIWKIIVKATLLTLQLGVHCYFW